MTLPFSCALAVAAASLLWAQDGPQPAPAETLTLPQVLELSERFNPQLRASFAGRDGAQAAIITARAYPNPISNYMAGPQSRRLPGAEPGLLQRFAGQQPLEWPDVRKSRILAAQIGLESSGFALEDTRLAVRAEVQSAFYTILRRRGELALAQETLRLIEDLQRRVQVQVDVGEAARLELTRAEAEVATAQALVNTARLRYLNAVATLRAVVSAPLPPNFEVQGQLDPPAILPALNELRPAALARHPLIAQAEADVRRARAVRENEVASRKPPPELVGEYELQPDLKFYRFGINLPIPIWNRREGPIAEAVALENRAEAILDFRRLELTAALERAFGQYQVANEQVMAFEKGVLQEAEAALRAAEAAFRFGERGIIEVLDAQRVLRTVRTEFLNAQFDRQAAAIELERLRVYDPVRQP
jgi:cobalt-zinc-cadmium efflux system outer membrane protein